MSRKVTSEGFPDLGKYAVFRRRRKQQMIFTSVHDTKDEAEKEALRLLAHNLVVEPDSRQLFFVIKIEEFFGKSESGFFGSKS